MPTQMTTAEARINDPVLTTHAIAYQEPMFSGHELFPKVDVTVHGGQIVDFGDTTSEVIDTLRSPGAAAAQVQVRYGKKAFALATHGLDAVVPREIYDDSANAPSVNISSRAVEQALKPVQRNIEIAQANLATAVSSFAANHSETLAGADRWGGDVDPTPTIIKAVNQIEVACGGTNIVVLLGADVMAALRTNNKIADKIKYSQHSIVTTELLAQLWGVAKVVIGRSLKKTASARTRIWGKNVVIAQVASNPGVNEPSFAYTYCLRGTPSVDMPYFEKTRRSWVYPVDADYQANVVMPEAGYLIKNAVA